MYPDPYCNIAVHSVVGSLSANYLIPPFNMQINLSLRRQKENKYQSPDVLLLVRFLTRGTLVKLHTRPIHHSLLQTVGCRRTVALKSLTPTVFIGVQSLQGSHSQPGITLNSFLSHTGCFTFLVRQAWDGFKGHALFCEMSRLCCATLELCLCVNGRLCEWKKKKKITLHRLMCIPSVQLCVWVCVNNMNLCRGFVFYGCISIYASVFVCIPLRARACVCVCVPDLCSVPCRDQWAM